MSIRRPGIDLTIFSLIEIDPNVLLFIEQIQNSFTVNGRAHERKIFNMNTTQFFGSYKSFLVDEVKTPLKILFSSNKVSDWVTFNLFI